MKKSNRLGAAALATLSLSFGSAALADDDRNAKPVTINGNKVEINCAKDFEGGQPSIAFMHRLDSAFHGRSFGSAYGPRAHGNTGARANQAEFKALLERNHPILKEKNFFAIKAQECGF